MSEPKFENKGSKYFFMWDAEHIKAEVSKIHSNHDSKLHCNLVFTTDHPKYNPHLLQDNFNLSSARSRSSMSKEMATRFKEPVKWNEILEYLSVKSTQEYEKGEPILELVSTDEAKPLEYLINPIVPLNKPTVIFGDPGSGKSQLAVVFNILIALPWTDNPLRLTPPNRPTVSLFCDYEADPDDIHLQLAALSRGMDLGSVSLHYRRCTLPLADDVEAIRNHMEAINAKCIFVDSTSLAAGGDLNKMDVATNYFRALRKLDITSISLAHTSKDRENKSKTVLGSILWEAGARSIIECRGQEDEDCLDIALFHRKANLSKKAKPMGYRITYGNGENTITWHDPTSVPEFVERMGNNKRILELLKKGSLTEKEITEALGISYQAAHTSLTRLSGKNVVLKLEGKRWGLSL